MPDDVSIKFGGDASGIKAAADQAKAATQGYASTARAANLTATEAFRTLTAEIRANTQIQREGLVAMQESAVAARETANALGTLQTGVIASAAAWVTYQVAARGAAYAGGLYSSAWGDIKTAQAGVVGAYQGLRTIAADAQAAAIAVRDVAASYGYIQRFSAMADVEQRGLLGSIGRIAQGYRDAATASEIAGSGITDMAARIAAGARNMEALTSAARAGDQNVSGYLASAVQQLMKIPGVTQEAAGGIVALYAGMENFSGSTFDAAVKITRVLAASTEEAKTLGASLSAALSDPAGKGEAFLTTLRGVTEEQRAAFSAAKQSGSVNQMNGAILAAAADKARLYAEEQTRKTREQIEAYNGLSRVMQGFYIDELFRLKDVQKENDRFKGQMEELVQTYERMARAVGATADSQRQLTSATAGMIAQGPEARIATLRGEAAALRQTLQGATGDAAEMIRKFENFAPAGKWDVNAFRNGYGSDTMTAPDGTVSRVREGSPTTREDAERDLQRRLVDEFIPRAASQIGEAWGQLSAAARASITSVVYNYGSIPPTVAQAARAAPSLGSEAPLAESIRRLSANPERRAQEAANITQNDGPAGTIERQKLDEAQALTNTLRGGTAEQIAQAANARTAAAGMRDEVEAAERLLVAAKEDAANAHSATAQREAGLRVDQARLELTTKQDALLRAQANQKTSGMDASDPERADIQNAMLDQILAHTRKNTTEAIALENEKAANIRAVEQGIATEKAAIENKSYENDKADIQTKLKNIRQEAAERGLSFEERRAQQFALNGQLDALERQHLQTLMEIWGEGNAQYRQAKLQLEMIDRESARRRQDTERELQKAAYLDTKRSYEQIGSTLTSNVFSVIQGQASIKQAAASTAMSLIQSYAQARVRMIADSLASASVHQGTEVANTAATVSGVTARTSASMAGDTAASAAKGATVMKSIASSAAETYAGVYGFLSPVLGPFAAAPAALAAGTVGAARGLVSFDKGSWDLPGDMVAQVHAGEMIVPAAVAADLRRSGAVERSGSTVRMPSIQRDAEAARQAQAGMMSGIAAARARVPSFAIGAWSLPADMTASLHRGEMVVPAAATPWAQSLMANAGPSGGGGGGAGPVTFNVNALDAAGVARFFKQHGRTLAKAVTDAQKDPSVRPTW